MKKYTNTLQCVPNLLSKLRDIDQRLPRGVGTHFHSRTHIGSASGACFWEKAHSHALLLWRCSRQPGIVVMVLDPFNKLDVYLRGAMR